MTEDITHPSLNRAPAIPGYRLLERIGQGSYGTVWYAEELLTGLRRAVKVLDKDPRAGRSDPQRELVGIRAYQQIAQGHANLLQIHHVGETADCFYYAMELADADADPDSSPNPPYRPRTLESLIGPDQPLPAGRALAIIADVLGGLAHLHAHGLLHRDVKPSNILLVEGRVKLADVGLVTPTDREVTQIGTPGYMPNDARLDRTADLYAAGKILYEMITGLHRSRFPELPVLHPATRHDRRTLRAAIHIANKAAHPDRRRRYTSAVELRQAVDDALRRPRFGWRATVGGAVALAALAGWSVWGRVERRRGPVPTIQLSDGERIDSADFRNGDDGHDEAGLASVTAEQTNEGGSAKLLTLRYADGLALTASFDRPISGQPVTVGFGGSGKSIVVIGFQAGADSCGRIIEFDPLEYRRTRRLTPLTEIGPGELRNSPPAAWNHQTFDKPCHVGGLCADELDGRPGDELVVAVMYVEGPTRLAVFTRGWKPIFEYWHYGEMSLVEAVDVDGDGLKEIVAHGLANERSAPRPDEPRRGIYEALYGAVLILNPRSPYDPRNPGHWSMNDWMNAGSPQRPLAYGYVARRADPNQGDDEADWTVDMVRVYPHSTEPFRVHLHNGWFLDLDASFQAIDFRKNSYHPKPLDPVPTAGEVWHRLWPPESGGP